MKAEMKEDMTLKEMKMFNAMTQVYLEQGNIIIKMIEERCGLDIAAGLCKIYFDFWEEKIEKMNSLSERRSRN